MARGKKRKRFQTANSQQVALTKNEQSSACKRTKKNVHLEGMVHKNELVLVDRFNGVVYSSSERTSSNDLVQVGQLVKGQIVLKPTLLPRRDPVTIHAEKKHDPVATATRKEKKEKGLSCNTSSCLSTASTEFVPESYPYDVDPDDHCETSITAYQHALPVLDFLRKKLGKAREELHIYDPYYCAGSVKRHLGRLQFLTVYNECEDCYKVWKDHQPPDYDVLLTNPPYSSNHVERLCQFIFAAGKPWFLLVPSYVCLKEYFLDAVQQGQVNPFFLTPQKRYRYQTPKQLRKDIQEKRTASFTTLWIVELGDLKPEFIRWYRARHKKKGPKPLLSTSLSQLPAKFLEKDVSSYKRQTKRKKQQQKSEGKIKC